jgi:hypothetical protein
MDITDIGKQVWFPSDYYQDRKSGIRPAAFGKPATGIVEKFTKATVTVSVKNKDKLGAPRYTKRYPINLVAKSKKDVFKMIGAK